MSDPFLIIASTTIIIRLEKPLHGVIDGAASG